VGFILGKEVLKSRRDQAERKVSRNRAFCVEVETIDRVKYSKNGKSRFRQKQGHPFKLECRNSKQSTNAQKDGKLGANGQSWSFHEASVPLPRHGLATLADRPGMS
jgi:hypothetical protein